MTDAWTLVFEGWEPADEGRREALCTLGNATSPPEVRELRPDDMTVFSAAGGLAEGVPAGTGGSPR